MPSPSISPHSTKASAKNTRTLANWKYIPEPPAATPPLRACQRKRQKAVSIRTDHLVHLVDLDRTDEQRFPALQVWSEAIRPRPAGEILDPAARVDEDQSRSFFSRRPRGLVPFARPR